MSINNDEKCEAVLSPNEELTEKIVAALGEAGLIAERHHAQVFEKMNDGTAKDTDWLSWVEMAISLETLKEAEENHG